MDSIFLSKIIGLFFIILSIAYLINPHHCKKVMHDITASYGMSSLVGSIGIIIGLIIIINHNIWDDFHQIVISLIGWIILILGLVFVFFPKSVSHSTKSMQKKHGWVWLNLIILIIGIFLTYLGFFNVK